MDDNRKHSAPAALYYRFVNFCIAVISKIPMPQKVRRFLNFETVSYIIIGASNTAVSYIAFGVFILLLRGDAADKQTGAVMAAQVISFIISVIYSFFANKSLVFESHDYSFKKTFSEFIAFVASRLFAFGVETAGIFLMYDLGRMNEWAAKLIMAVVVIILNYITGKLMVFRKKDDIK